MFISFQTVGGMICCCYKEEVGVHMWRCCTQWHKTAFGCVEVKVASSAYRHASHEILNQRKDTFVKVMPFVSPRVYHHSPMAQSQGTLSACGRPGSVPGLGHTKTFRNQTSCSLLVVQCVELGLGGPLSVYCEHQGYHVKCVGSDIPVRQHYKVGHLAHSPTNPGVNKGYIFLDCLIVPRLGRTTKNSLQTHYNVPPHGNLQ